MPKVTLRFNLPEETHEFNLANKGHFYADVIDDLDDYLRSKIKYGSEGMSDEQYQVYEEIRKKLTELRYE